MIHNRQPRSTNRRNLGWTRRLGQNEPSTALPAGWTMTPTGPVDTAILTSTLRVCDASGNCTIVPQANYEAAAQAVNAGVPIAQVASQYGGTAVQSFSASVAAGASAVPAAPAPAQIAAAAPPPPPAAVSIPSAGPPTLPGTAVTTAPGYLSYEVPGNFDYTADIETVEQILMQYGYSTASAQQMVNNFYAAGTTPGTVSSAQVMASLGLTSTSSTTASTVSLTDVSTWPWYYWAAAAAGAYLLFK